jgi:alkaline phosphatase D
MPPETVEVAWEIATDDRLRRVVRRGTAIASPELAHSVHVELAGLEPARPYWYRFHAAGATSPVGRALTMSPAGQVPPALRFAFASCQHYEHGWYTAYRHLVGDDPDLVAFLGDYIYEGAGLKQSIRMHPGGKTITLADYRNRYALYKTDPDLQAAHAHCPWVATWDDHEVENTYAGAISQDRDPADAFLARRAAAYQAWYEHLPMRVSARPRGPDARLYRSVDVGGLAKFFVLDTRQYRTDQPCGDRRKAPCPEMFAPESTMLGSEQERWLLDGMARSEARWNVLAQQVFLSHEDAEPGPEEAYFMDSWNRSILRALAPGAMRPAP